MTAAIVLAAGSGTRFGGGKMLALVHRQPMLQHVLDLAAEADIHPVVVVLGNDAGAIESAVRWRDELRVRNDDPGRGISSSIALGLRVLDAASPAIERAVVLLGDQPRLSHAQLSALLAASSDRPITVPRYANGEPGNPVVLDRAAWPLASALQGDRGMSQVFALHPDMVRYVDVSGSNPDIDTRTDLDALSRGGGPARSGRTGAADRNTP